MENELLENIEEADKVILIKKLRYGQPHPYADSVYECEITITGKNIASSDSGRTILVPGSRIPESVVLNYVKTLFHHFEISSEADWCDPVLKKCEKIKETAWGSVWHIVINRAYLG